MIVLLSTSAWALNQSTDLLQYAHSAWTLRDGTLTGYPRSLAQTSDGYLWLGTEFGVLRFDGVRFVAWDLLSGAHLPDSSVLKLFPSSDGALWIGTTRGLARLKNGTLTKISDLAGQRVSALVEDRKGTLWAGTSAGLGDSARLCTIQSDRATCYGSNGMFGRIVSTLSEDKDGHLWVGATTGLWRWNPAPATRYPLPGDPLEIHSVIETDNGDLLVAINREITQITRGSVEPYAGGPRDPQFKPTALLRDRDGGVWIGTQDQGLLHVHRGRTDRFTRADGLSSDSIQGLFEDREGDVWVATLNGLDRFRDFAVTTISTRQGLSGDVVLSVLGSRDGSVWIGTTNGLNRWVDGQMTVDRTRTGITNDVAASLFQDDRGDIWASSLQGVAHRNGLRFTSVKGIPSGYVHAIAEDNANDLWLSDQNRGLFRLRKGDVVEFIPWSQFGGQSARALLGDPIDGGLWLGFFQGGVSYFKNDQIGVTYTATNGLGEGQVTSLYFDHDGALWTATPGGLGHIKNKSATVLTSKNGLPCNTVFWVTQDDAFAFWLDTACGLVSVAKSDMDAWASGAKQTIRVTLYGAGDGVPSHASVGGYSPKMTKATDGRLWFAGYDGVSVVDPKHLPFNTMVPPVHIERVTADRATYDAGSIVSIPSPAHDVRIDYTALSLVAPEKVTFHYMLEGRDRDWVDAGTRRQAFYTDLPPKEYRFHVIASNNDGVWNQQGDTWALTIRPAFYQTNSFRAALAIFSAILLWSAHRIRLRRVAAQLNLRYEDRLAERTRIAQELHDTLLQGFISVSMQLHVMVDEIAAPVRPKLDVILRRITQIVEEGRQTVQGLRTTHIADDLLEHALARDAEEFRGEQNVEIRLVVEGTRQSLNPLVSDEVYRICREALANAFRHSRGTGVEIAIEYMPQHLKVQVVDNGCGMGPDVVKFGRSGHWGITGMRERAERIGASLRLWSRPNAGSGVELLIPGRVVFQRPVKSHQRGWPWQRRTKL